MIKDVITRLRSAKRKEEQDPQYFDSLCGTLQAVRAALETDGHIYHRESAVRDVLGAICEGDGERAEAEWRGLIASGFVVDVSPYIPEPLRGGKWYAWRHHVEGEIAFAKSAVDHAYDGGKAVIYYGEPGTGKTHQVALRILEANEHQAIGSALNHSARNLENKVKELAKEQGLPPPAVRIQTVHRSHDAKVDPLKYKLRDRSSVVQFVVDELGQVGADTAGMAARQWHSKAKLVLSVGPGQLHPVGPGQIGEDLLACLGETNGAMKGWELKELTENYRTKSGAGEPATGIVDFFRAVAAGTVGEFEDLFKTDKPMPPGLVLLPVHTSRTGSGYGDTMEMAPAGGALYETPHSEPQFFVPLDVDGSEIIAVAYQQFKADLVNRKTTINIEQLEDGERIRLKFDTPETRAAGWKKGTKGTVVRTKDDGRIVIKPAAELKGNVVTVARKQIRRYCAITAHSAQGLEVDFGVVVALRSRITNRRWLYTAASRCKRLCVVICEAGSLDGIVNNPANNIPRRTLFPTFFRMFRREREI